MLDEEDVPIGRRVEVLETWLTAKMSKLEAMVGAPLSQNGLVELTALYNDVAYLFLDLDAKETQGSDRTLLLWRSAFFADAALRKRILSRLDELHCTDFELEESRLAYVEELRQESRPVRSEHDEQLDVLLDAATAVVKHMRAAEARLLERLGVAAPAVTRPAAVMYQVMSRTKDAAVREKLGEAWNAQRTTGQTKLLEFVDRMVEVRRERAAALGLERVVDDVFRKCTVSSSDVETFLEGYLARALESQKKLLSRMAASLGMERPRPVHFGYYVRSLIGDEGAPLFSPDTCLEYIFDVSMSVFGLRCEVRPADNDAIIKVVISSASQPVGHIRFDLWGTGGGPPANHTKGVRNRTDWPGVTQLPVAHVCCGFQRGAGTVKRLTFQNVHSLFHEFGHAINHLLITKRISNRAGLEYLPLERLEYLSLWFEKWAYHSAFAAAVAPSAGRRHALQMCQRVKALEYSRTQLERGVVAALDYLIHSEKTGGIREAFTVLEQRYKLEGFLALGDILEYFTWPMFQANPGANFAYLWGAADSAQKFEPFETLELSAIAARPELRRLFAPSFDLSPSTEIPQAGALFAFYERVACVDVLDAERGKHERS